jgi:predicted DNA-binding WGR domain protein
MIFDETRGSNQVVSDFLFKNTAEGKKEKSAVKGITKNAAGNANRPRRDSLDSLEFADGNRDSIDDGRAKPSSHSTLDYRHWRQDIIPAIQNQLIVTEEIVDDDLHEFEDTQIYNKTNLDIKVIHIYLHNLDNWYGTDDDRDDFKLQIQYGRLHSNGKFEVKHYSKDDEDSIKTDCNLQYFCNFKYSKGYNHVKVKIVTTESESKVCHCYVDIRGQQRGKFIYFQKTMNAKEYTQNPESQFALT